MKNFIIVFLILLIASLSFAQELEEQLKPLLKNWESFKYDKEYWDNYDFFAHQPYIVWGTLTEEDDEDEYDMNETIAYTAQFRMNKWQDKDGLLGEVIEDTEITLDIIKEHDLCLVGTPQSNLILKLMPEM